MRILPDMGIPLPDGTRLSARVWMPSSAETEPVPAILEYLPYRKSDGTAERDHGMHLHFARAGYACLRVDRRGCGDSEGLFDDEYSETELQDGVDIINWIAAQPWCTGRVGMQGISWGGFNGVQIAARAPERLKAVVSIGTTVDRYHDDIHYKGGVQLSENIGWAATVASWFSMPPDPEIVGHNRWRGMWLERLENAPFLASRWIRHPNRDAYWKHGSICEGYDGLKAAVLVMGGLHDGYRNAMAAMVENLDAPVKGIAGPWSHKYPNISTIGPSIDYLGEALRWWDHWLKDKETGVAGDPAYRAYVMESARPDPSLNHRKGRWIGLRQGPSESATRQVFGLGDGVLGEAEELSKPLGTDLPCGRNSGEFFPFGFGPGELPDDQSHDDAHALSFDSAPMDADRVMLGAPKLSLSLIARSRVAQVVARLCDVRPDGSSALISLGMRDLRKSHDFTETNDLRVGEIYEVPMVLDQVAYELPKGHRLRLSLSTSYWPYSWPEGEAVALTLTSGALSVPWLEAEKAREVRFDAPCEIEKRRYRQLTPGDERKEWRVDADTGRRVLEIHGDHGRREDLENGLITESAVTETWEIDDADPASAQVEIVWTRSLGRGDWEVSSKVVTRMRGEAGQFVIEQQMDAFEGGEKALSRTWRDTIPR